MGPEFRTAPAAPAVRFPGRPRVAGVSSHECRFLHDGWESVSVAPNAAADPAAAARLAGEWRCAVVPGTVASSLRAEGTLDLENAPDFDAVDWWYRCRFSAEPSSHARVLCFDGLATLAEVWLNGTMLLRSEDMFLRHEVDVTDLLARENELVIRFGSLKQSLAARRPRPRWRAKGIEHQQLRWHRTTLVGRMPGWSPPVKAVGPWRAMRLETRRTCEVVSGDIHAVPQTSGGAVEVSLQLRMLDRAELDRATLHVGDGQLDLHVGEGTEGVVVLSGSLTLPNAEHWWPHTHGLQPRYDARIVLETSNGPVEIGFPPIAFRGVSVHRSNNGFAIKVNGLVVFCRGSCWTSVDVVSLGGSDDAYRHLLTLARDAGMNMMRIGGTMVYEADVFYDLCDELGIFVWQDFMFANMDYPTADPAFAELVDREVVGELARLRRHPCMAVLCGNSEVEQQAAMLGLGKEQWINPLFYERLPALCATGMPDVPYWPGTPSGGPLPFHVDTGVAHYYGIGAYLRPLEDARRSNVRFAAECLGFANVPDQRALDALLPNGEAPFHHPRWKARVPRDQGMGWDHDDIRDHYLRELFGVDPMRLRYSDIERYIALSRVVTGEVMGCTIREFRRGGSSCRGALTWFFQDLWLGAGFGMIDSTGRPKPVYYALKRAMQPVTVSITNEGTSGLQMHLVNDLAQPLEAELTLRLLRGARTVVAATTVPVHLEARQATCVVADAVLGRFYDTSYAYRFGPPVHDVAVATLRERSGRLIGQSFAFPLVLPSDRSDDVSLAVDAWMVSEQVACIRLRADRFTPWIALELGDFLPEDNYFHMGPETERLVLARSTTARRFSGYVQPLNVRERSPILMRDEESTTLQPRDP